MVVIVPRRHEGQGTWPHGTPPMVQADHGAVERAMQRRAERVAEELRGGKRARRSVDATSVRALLLDRGALDHHEIAAALDGTPADAAHVLTHLRNTGHVHRADTRKRPRTTPGDVGGPHMMGVWELTAQGRAATKRQQKGGGKLSTYNDAGYRSAEPRRTR